MSSLCTNPKSVHFPIRGNELSQFLKKNNGQYFASKSLSIHNIPFNVYIYPNGIDNKNIAYVQFIVIPNLSKTSAIKSVTVCCKLFCSMFQIMFKQVRILNNEKDSIEWSKQQLALSECQRTIKNGMDYLDFVCDIEILKIKKNSNSHTLPNLSRKLSLRKQSSSSLLPAENIVFQPRTLLVKSHVHIEWVITNKMIHLFKHSVSKKCIYSQDINNMWCLCIYPNGMKHKKNSNNVELDLKLMRLPENIRSIEVDFVVKMTGEQLLQSRKVVFSYIESHQLVKLFATSKLNEMDSFKLSIIIKVIRIFEDKGKKHGKEVTTDWSKFNIDEFEPAVFKCNVDYGENKSSDECDDEKSSHTTGSPDVAENISVSKTITQSKLQQSQSKTPPRKPSYSSLAPPISSRNISHSITALSNDQSNPLPHITEHKEDKQYQLDIKRWSDQKNDEMDINMYTIKTNTIALSDSEKKDNTAVNNQNIASDNIFFIKFKQWLEDEVQLPEYLLQFRERGSADIKLVKSFDDQTLTDIGINNIAHRKHIIDEAKSFKQGQDNFEELIKKHDALKLLRKNFRKNAILTDDDLHNMSKPELQKVLSIEQGDAKVNELWNIIHQTQSQNTSPVSPKQLQMNQFKEQYKVMKTAMDTWLTQLLNMHDEANDEKEGEFIRPQADTILHEYSSKLINHRTILDQLMTASHFQQGNLKFQNTKAQTLDLQRSDEKEIDSSNGTSTEPNYSDYNFSHNDSDKVIPKSELASVSKNNKNGNDSNQSDIIPKGKVGKSIALFNNFGKNNKKKKNSK